MCMQIHFPSFYLIPPTWDMLTYENEPVAHYSIMIEWPGIDGLCWVGTIKDQANGDID